MVFSKVPQIFKRAEAPEPTPIAAAIQLSRPPNDDEHSGAVHRAAARLPWRGTSSP